MQITLRTALISAVGCLGIGVASGVALMLGDAPAAIPAYVQQQIKDMTKEKEAIVAQASQLRDSAAAATEARDKASKEKAKALSGLAAARARVAELEGTIGSGHGGASGTGMAGETPDDCAVHVRELNGLVDAQRVLIAKQDEALAKTDSEAKAAISEANKWHKSSDQWESAYNKSEALSRIKISALQSQVSASKSQRWRGRFEGFGAGVIAGQVPRLFGWSFKF